jgi:hypothetical protein
MPIKGKDTASLLRETRVTDKIQFPTESSKQLGNIN